MRKRPLNLEKVLTDVGRRIAELRSQRDLTQEQLAARADIGWKYLQQIELGYENLTLQSLVKFANLFGVGLGELVKAPKTKRVRPGRPRSRRK